MANIRFETDEVPGPVRYCIRGGKPASYTVDGLETLAWRKEITPETEIAPEGTQDFRPIRAYPFLPAVFPIKTILRVRGKPKAPASMEGGIDEIDLRNRAAAKELRELLQSDSKAPKKIIKSLLLRKRVSQKGPHITSADEIRARLRRDPNDPEMIRLLVTLQARMTKEGISATEALEAHFESNRTLNARIRQPKPRFVAEKTQERKRLVGLTFILWNLLATLPVFLTHGGVSGYEWTSHWALYAYLVVGGTNGVMLAAFLVRRIWQDTVRNHIIAVVIFTVIFSQIIGRLIAYALSLS